LLGQQWPTPIYLSAVAAQRAFGGEGEIDTAHAAATRSTLMMLSSDSSTAPEDVIKARGAPVWQQLYPTDVWAVTEAVVRRAQRAGATAIVLTADYMPGRNNETLQRGIRRDTRQCDECHSGNSPQGLSEAPIYDGLDVSHVKELVPPSMTWEYLDRLRHIVSVKLLVKGIVTGEDADNCVRHGADGVIVSNHGGRNEETLRSTIECLPEVVAAVRRRVPVLIDGGVRRGTDVFKALALGASAVGIGRPQAWGLGAFGQPGVEAVLDIYKRELHSVMQQAGTASVTAITRDHVVLRGSRGAFGLT
jgi:4-hydroxymandelate oxidase